MVVLSPLGYDIDAIIKNEFQFVFCVLVIFKDSMEGTLCIYLKILVHLQYVDTCAN